MTQPAGPGASQPASPSASQLPGDSAAVPPPADLRFDDPSSRMLGQYKLERRVGQGGMGVVFLAQDTALDRQVAVKVLLSSPVDDPKIAERFQREAKSLARVRHPNLVQIYNVGATQNFQYFAMEYLEGLSLTALLRERKKLPPEELLSIVGQLLSALHVVHKEGIVHRDLKCSNIMICLDRAVLMDFGLAKDESQSGLTSVGVVLGTPDYMAPEQADAGEITPATDVYSLGIVMYEALAGRLPFEGKSAYSIITQHMQKEPPKLLDFAPQIPPSLAAVVHKCIAKKPQDRYADCVSLAADLAQIVPVPELVRLAGMPLKTGQTVSRVRSITGAVPQSPSMQATMIASSGAVRASETNLLPNNQNETSKTQMLVDEKDPRFPWAWMTIGFILVLVLGLGFFWSRRKATDSANPKAFVRVQPSVTGGEEFRWIGFKSNGTDSSKWVYVVERKQADGTWKREELNQTAFQKIAPNATELRFLPPEK